MRKILAVLVGIVVLFGVQQAEAFDPQDLKRLLETKSCPKCNLRGADLRYSHLERAYVLGANLEGADLYQEGLGTPQNLKRAYILYSITAAKGYEASVKDRDNVAKKLTNEEIIKGIIPPLPINFDVPPLKSHAISR